jgi:hypothetical protein
MNIPGLESGLVSQRVISEEIAKIHAAAVELNEAFAAQSVACVKAVLENAGSAS